MNYVHMAEPTVIGDPKGTQEIEGYLPACAKKKCMGPGLQRGRKGNSQEGERKKSMINRGCPAMQINLSHESYLW